MPGSVQCWICVAQGWLHRRSSEDYILQEMGRFDDAIDAHQRARDIYLELGDRHREGIAWNNLGIVLWEVGRFDKATHAGGEAVAAFNETGDLKYAAQARRWLDDMGPCDGFASA